MFSRKVLLLILTAIMCSNCYTHAQAQVNTTSLPPLVYKVAVFAPLYLDSVFTNSKLKSEKAIPRFILPSLDFVQGAQIALDSLELSGHRVEAFIYDTKSVNQSITWLSQHKVLDSVNLIIGNVKELDFKQLADFALRKNIPFISATYPNDGGVTSNPFLTIVNSTLKAHVEAIHSYILENHGTEKIFLCRKRGSQEDKIAYYFKELNEQEGKPLLSMQTLYFDSSVSPSYFKNKIDSLHPAVIIGASLDEDFARQLSDAVFVVSKKHYPVTLIGMPNWDGFHIFSRKDSYKGLPVHFTTPYYNSKSDQYFNFLGTEYMRRFKSKPTDMACKGFEIVQYFTKVLMQYPLDVMSHLNEKKYQVFSEYNFRPVFTKQKNGIPDYFENKHLYVMKIMNGSISREW